MFSNKSIYAAVVVAAFPALGLAQSEIDQDQLGALLGNVDAEQAVAFGSDIFGGENVVVQGGAETHAATVLASAESDIDPEQADVMGANVAAPSAGGGRIGFVWANNPTSSSYTPSTTYAFNASGGPVTITRSSTGTYSVRFAGLGGPRPGGNVQVTGYGSDPADCKVRWWSSGGSDFIATVNCYSPTGARTDARYTVLVTRRP